MRTGPVENSAGVAVVGERTSVGEVSSAVTPARLSRPLVALLAVASGATVANLYYAQPLLDTIARAFGLPAATAGLLVTIAQIGYVAGLVLVVPLGDLIERRRLIVGALVVVAAGQALVAAAPSFAVLALAVGAVGVSAVATQIIVPLAASLARDFERGRVVGTVMSGLLLGILLARTLSGLLADLAGWRAVFAATAAAMLALALLLHRTLPRLPTGQAPRYPALLRSIAGLVHDEPVLRQRMVLGAAAMGCFSVLWTAIAFLLAGAPYHYGTGQIGLFGLAGAVGALAAPLAGRLADRGHAALAASGALVALLASWALLDLGGHSLLALIAGIVVLDFGVQALHITNQHAIFALHSHARSRLTTAYMSAYFLGGAVLSAATSALYATLGWHAVCVLGAGTALLALAVWSGTQPRLAQRHDVRRAT